jgi:hypothetical protein
MESPSRVRTPGFRLRFSIWIDYLLPFRKELGRPDGPEVLFHSLNQDPTLILDSSQGETLVHQVD